MVGDCLNLFKFGRKPVESWAQFGSLAKDRRYATGEQQQTEKSSHKDGPFFWGKRHGAYGALPTCSRSHLLQAVACRNYLQSSFYLGKLQVKNRDSNFV